jgi:dTDP-4-dehydrorhamnose reductase
VTGRDGQLGSELKALANQFPYLHFEFIDFHEMDLTSDQSIVGFFEDRKYDFVIHCAAYTAVDIAEQEPSMAYRINAEAVRTVAEICRQKQMRLIFISTDYVFEGNRMMLLNEEMETNPLSVYGKSKLQGEQYVKSLLPDAVIIRTAWVYSTYASNFVKTILRLARERDKLRVVADQIGSPTLASDLALAILTIIESIVGKRNDHPGIFHFTNQGSISWYDFARYIVQFKKLPCEIEPINTNEHPVLAKRPAFSVMDKRKIQAAYDITPPYWSDSLQKCLKLLE